MMKTLAEINADTVILVVDKPDEAVFLTRKTHDVVFADVPLKDRRRLTQTMRRIMKRAKGIGLSANQIGLPLNLFVAEIPKSEKDPRPQFFAVFNPRIKKTDGPLELEEGCLSVPGKVGVVKRFEEVTIVGTGVDGKPLEIKAKGLLAHIFQHETDHLSGTLFIDKAERIYVPQPVE